MIFRGTAPYYARYRPPYPPELLDLLAVTAGLDGSGRLLDLGCGTGPIAIPLAERFDEVVAVDIEPEMLAELERDAPANVQTVLARAEDVDASWGAFRLATIGRALHWMDSDVVLGRLVDVTSIVALLAERSEESEAKTTVRIVAEELLGERPARRNPKARYAQILAASPFGNVEELSVRVERTWTIESLIGYAYSTSFASLARVGARRDEFERELRARLKPHYRETVRVDAIVGKRV